MSNPKDACGRAKPSISVLPIAPIMECCAAMEEGRQKYGPWNWREADVNRRVYIDAAIRHLLQDLSGEDIDPDSDLPHVTKAIAGLLILRDAMIHGNCIDDREVRQDLRLPEMAEKIAAVRAKHAPAPEPDPEPEPEVHTYTQKDVGQVVRLRDGREAVVIDVAGNPGCPKIQTKDDQIRLQSTGNLTEDREFGCDIISFVESEVWIGSEDVGCKVVFSDGHVTEITQFNDSVYPVRVDRNPDDGAYSWTEKGKEFTYSQSDVISTGIVHVFR